MIQGYELENIWNEDETGCFFRALPDKTLAEKRKECRGGKRSKERLTVAFFANAAGDKEPPVVIGKAAKPRCFKGLRNLKKPHGIPYHSNTKAWMNNEIMTALLATLNRRLLRTGRKILLLIDNVSSHDPALQEKFSNIKVVFLPINTTSKLQPLDAGIIKNFKCHYRKLLLSHVLSQIDGNDFSASEIIKSVNVLTAIRWIKEAWDKVKPETIRRCFKTCGINLDDSEDQPLEDPFADIQGHLDGLMKQIEPACNSEDYLNADDDLSTCQTYDIDGEASNWREELRAIACASVEDEPSDVEVSSEDDEPEPEKSSIGTHKEAIRVANDLLLYLSQNGEEEIAEIMGRS